MSGILYFVAIVTIVNVVRTVSGNVNQCYHCNSKYCGDFFDIGLGAIISCSDVFRNAKQYSSRIVAAPSSSALQNNYQVGSNNSEDIETVTSQDTNEVIRQRTHAEFYDIQRKIWDFFNRGEIDEYTQFVCVKANYNSDNGERKTYRGCVPKYTRTISTACDFVNQKVAGASTSTSRVTSCYTCEGNLCNGASHLKTCMWIAAVLSIILKVVV